MWATLTLQFSCSWQSIKTSSSSRLIYWRYWWDDILPAAAWSAKMSSLVYSWQVKLVDESGRFVSRLLSDMTKPANTPLSDDAEYVHLACPQVDLLIGHKMISCWLIIFFLFLYESRLHPPTLRDLAECVNTIQYQINLLEILADDILPVSVLPATRISPVYRWWVKMKDNSGRVVIRLL